MIIGGVDAGTSGAIAILSHDATCVEVFDIPRIMVKKGSGSARAKINGVELAGIIDELAKRGPIIWYVEEVHPRAITNKKNGEDIPGDKPKRSVLTEWQLCSFYERTIGILNAHRFRIEFVTPQRWRKGVGVRSTTRDALKEEARLRAMEMWPEARDPGSPQRHLFGRKEDHNRAEAALIAYHGWAQRLKGGDAA